MGGTISEYTDVILGSTFTTLNFYFIMMYMQSKSVWWLFLAFASAALVVVMFIRLFSHRDVIGSFVIVKVAAIVFSLPIGFYLFKRNVEFRHLVGVALAVTAVYFLR